MDTNSLCFMNTDDVHRCNEHWWRLSYGHWKLVSNIGVMNADNVYLIDTDNVYKLMNMNNVCVIDTSNACPL